VADVSHAYKIRPAVPSDAPGISAIYNQGIRDRVATFETRERAADEMVPRIRNERFPFLVADAAGEVAGWVAASEYRSRDCYAGVAEFSVYVAREHRGAGVGRTLMESFLSACADSGFWKILSRVFPENRGSRALLAA
jgi:phosphinothricin acetyltransferase